MPKNIFNEQQLRAIMKLWRHSEISQKARMSTKGMNELMLNFLCDTVGF
jgi:hypothetical protein